MRPSRPAILGLALLCLALLWRVWAPPRSTATRGSSSTAWPDEPGPAEAGAPRPETPRRPAGAAREAVAFEPEPAAGAPGPVPAGSGPAGSGPAGSTGTDPDREGSIRAGTSGFEDGNAPTQLPRPAPTNPPPRSRP